MSRRAPILAIFLLVAVAFGAAAAMLVASPSTPGAPSPLITSVPFTTGLWVFAGVTIALGILYLVLNRGEGGAGIPASPALAVLGAGVVVAIILTVAASLAHAISGAGGGDSGPSGPPDNNTSAPPPVNPPTGGGTLAAWAPGWIPWIVLGVVTVVIVALLVPFLLRRGRRPAPAADSNASRRAGIAKALQKLDASARATPRERILALYAQLLARVAPVLRRLDALTAREVASAVLDEWHVPAASAATLTDLFEEARYSDHPMSEASVDRARRALQDALNAIDLTPRPS